MSFEYPQRSFQVWEWAASHPRLLIRSPGIEDGERNIDLVFVDVSFISSPNYLGEIRLDVPTPAEVSLVSVAVGRDLPPERVFILATSKSRSIIGAYRMEISENSLNPFKRVFD